MTAKLVVQELRHDWIRFASAVCGIAAATALLVWSMGFVMTSIAQNQHRVEAMTAPYSCWVSPVKAGTSSGGRGIKRPVRQERQQSNLIPDAFVTEVEKLEEVRRADRFSVISSTLDFRPDGRVLQGPPVYAGICRIPDNGSYPYKVDLYSGSMPAADSTLVEGVICRSVFTPRRFTPPDPGEIITVIIGEKAVKIKITGVIDLEESIRGFPTLFVTEAALQKITANNNAAAGVDLLLCETTGRSALKAINKLADEFENGKFIGCVIDRSVVKRALTSDKLRNFKKQLPLLLTLSILAALCIITNALNMGLDKRMHSLAQLRCAGMTKKQISAVVIFEGALISICGWVLGFTLCLAALHLFAKHAGELFPEGVSVGWVTPLASATLISFVTLLALMLPCRRAVKVKALDAIRTPKENIRAISITKGLIGVVLVSAILLLVQPLPISATAVSVLILGIGIPLHIYGLILFIPLLMRAVESFATPLLSKIFQLDVRILQRRIMRHFSLYAGMVITLAIGLGAYTAIHIWGASLIAPFLPSTTLPDVIVDFLPGGISAETLNKINALDSIDRPGISAIVSSQHKLAPQLTEQIERHSSKALARGFDNILLLGVDVQKVFGGENPLSHMQFEKGSASDAVTALTAGDSCLITKMFARQSGLSTGDKMAFQSNSPRRGDSAAAPMQELTIVGIVDLNWHLATSRGKLRGRNGFGQGTTGPVFVREQLARFFSGNPDKTYYIWLNMSKKYAGVETYKAGSLLEQDIRKLCANNDSHTIRIHHRDEIADGTLSHGAQIIDEMAKAPFYSMIILALGMISLIIGSAERSLAEINTMRAIGMTRSQLARMLFIEALVIGICGIVLSLISGICIGWTFTGWTRAWMSFGGLPCDLTIPWTALLRGVALFSLLCIIIPIAPVWWIVSKRS